MIESHALYHDLGMEDNFDFLDIFYPCFEIRIPTNVREFYNLLTSFVSLESGMDGVSFRETRAGLSKILKDNGYCSVVTSPFVDMFENKLLEQYSEDRKADKK